MDSNVELLVAVSALIIIVAVIIWSVWRKNSNLPPGPWGPPLIGKAE